MPTDELQSLKNSENKVVKYIKDFLVDTDHFTDTSRFNGLLPNKQIQVKYQSSIAVEDTSTDIYFNLLHIVTVTTSEKVKFRFKDSLFEDLSFTMRHFGEGLSGEKLSTKDTTHSYKFTYSPVSFKGVSVTPYTIVNLNLKGAFFDSLSLTFVIPFPLSSFYTEDSEDNLKLFNTLNDVIVEKIPDHMTSKSPSSNNFKKDAERFFEILRSWVKQGSPLNDKYEKLN